MYQLTSGALALAEQLRQKAQGLPTFQIKEYQERARILRTKEDANLTVEAKRKTKAALSLQNETARKKKQEFNQKMENIIEEQEAQRRKKILQRLEL